MRRRCSPTARCSSRRASCTIRRAGPGRPPAAAAPFSRATLLPNGKVLAEGGLYFNGHVTEARPHADLYDPASGTWTATGSLTTARYEPHGDVAAQRHGARHRRSRCLCPLASAELYDPASETWSPTGRLVTPRAHHSATLLPNGKVLIAGGDTGYGNGVMASAELYDPASGIWTSHRQPWRRALSSQGNITAQRQGARCRRRGRV